MIRSSRFAPSAAWKEEVLAANGNLVRSELSTHAPFRRPDMLRGEPDADQAAGKPLEPRPAPDQTKGCWQPRSLVRFERGVRWNGSAWEFVESGNFGINADEVSAPNLILASV
jgi:hypothetical protein